MVGCCALAVVCSLACVADSQPPLEWNTFMGSSDSEARHFGAGVALDSSGNIYIAGYSEASGAPQSVHTPATGTTALSASWIAKATFCGTHS